MTRRIPFAVAGAALLLLAVSGCSATTFDASLESTTSTVAATTTLPTGTVAELLPRMLTEVQALMLDGHFDYGNGYHGRTYLNPHQLFRYPSTIWRLAQALDEILAVPGYVFSVLHVEPLGRRVHSPPLDGPEVKFRFARDGGVVNLKVDWLKLGGPAQALVFRETADELPAYDGHHVQIAVADFSGVHRRLLARGLVTEESNQSQYRFQDIIDLGTGQVLATLEHEVRSMRHPLFARALVNRSD